MLQDQIGELQGTLLERALKNTEVEEELIQTQQQYQGVARITLVCVTNYALVSSFQIG